MARRLITGIVLASVTGLSVVACSGGSATHKAAPEVVWAGNVCANVMTSSQQLSMPNIADPVKAVPQVLDLMSKTATSQQVIEAKLETAGKPPVTNGTATLAQTLANLKDYIATLQRELTYLKSAKIKDKRSLETAQKAVQADFVKLAAYRGPVADLRTNPALSKAFDQAPSCQTRKL